MKFAVGQVWEFKGREGGKYVIVELTERGCYMMNLDTNKKVFVTYGNLLDFFELVRDVKEVD